MNMVNYIKIAHLCQWEVGLNGNCSALVIDKNGYMGDNKVSELRHEEDSKFFREMVELYKGRIYAGEATRKSLPYLEKNGYLAGNSFVDMNLFGTIVFCGARRLKTIKPNFLFVTELDCVADDSNNPSNNIKELLDSDYNAMSSHKLAEDATVTIYKRNK